MNEQLRRRQAGSWPAAALPALLLASLLAAGAASSGGTPSLDRQPTVDMTVTTTP
jgi:hypothetical protein